MAFRGCRHLGMARALHGAALAPRKALEPACAASAALSYLSLTATFSDTALAKGIREVQEMLPGGPRKCQKPELSLLPKTGKKLQPPSPAAAPLHLNRQPSDMQFINGQFLPVPKHTRSQQLAGQQDPSKATLVSERLG